MAGAVTATGLAEAQRRLADRAARIRDMSAVMKVIGQDLVTETDNSFARQQSPAGEAWPGLAQSTKMGRVGRLKAANKRTKAGALTAGASRLRASLLGVGGMTPLVDTGRMRNSVRVRPARRAVQWSAVGYMAPHMTGGKEGRPPKRNPSPFEFVGGRWRLVPRLSKKYAEMIVRWIERGQG